LNCIPITVYKSDNTGDAAPDVKEYEEKLKAYSRRYRDERDLHSKDPIGYALAVLSNGRIIAGAEGSEELMARFDKAIADMEACKVTGHTTLDDAVKKILHDAFYKVNHEFYEGAHSSRFNVFDKVNKSNKIDSDNF
jgi:hypothetical protein